MRFLLFFCCALAVINSSFGQARVRKFTTPLAGKAVLKDVDDQYNAQVYSLEAPDPDQAKETGELDVVKEQVARQFPRKRSGQLPRKTTSAPSPVIDVSYVSDSFPQTPPDNYLAVNRQNQAVAVMNSLVSVHNAATGAMVTRKGLKQFSAAVGLNNITNDNRYDPKIIYDPEADRYISIMLNGINQYNYIVVGFSQTSDATGAWNFYKFYGDVNNDTTFFDYPCISLTNNELFITGNKVMDNISWQVGFKESVIYQVRKQDGYNGNATLTYQLWDNIQYNGRYIRNVYPVKGGAGLKGPAQYFVGNRILDVQNDTIFLVKIPDTIGSTNNNLVATALVSNINYGVPPDGRQPDTSATLMTNDGRILGGYAEGNEIQFVSASVNTATGASGIYHGIISNYTTTPTVQAQIFTVDTLDFGYPNLSYTGNKNGHNQSIITFNYTGKSTYPGFATVFFDGSAYSDMVRIKTGDNSIKILSTKEQRWGDYSGSQPDWNAIQSVWAVGIYGRKDHLYGNYMARILSPFYAAVPQVKKQAAASVIYPNPTWEYVSIQFELEKEDVLNFYIYDAAGHAVGQLTSSYCFEGKNIIKFNVASLKSGTYFLKAFNSSGSSVITHTFVKQ